MVMFTGSDREIFEDKMRIIVKNNTKIFMISINYYGEPITYDFIPKKSFAF